MPRCVILIAVLALLGGCDTDNVEWAFVSSPGGSFGKTGGAVIVIRVSSSSAAGLEGEFLRFDGFDDDGAVSVLLPLKGDFAVLRRAFSVELRSPALPGRVELDGAGLHLPPPGGPAAMRLSLPDTSLVHPSAVGPGTLHVASAGTLMILESATGIVVFGEEPEPEVLGLSVTLTTTPPGDAYALLLPDNRLRLLVPPPLPSPAQRVRFDEARSSVSLLGPSGAVLAELPAAAVNLQNGAGGVFAQASLPQGLPGDPVPMSLLMAADNRYLLRVNG